MKFKIKCILWELSTSKNPQFSQASFILAMAEALSSVLSFPMSTTGKVSIFVLTLSLLISLLFLSLRWTVWNVRTERVWGTIYRPWGRGKNEKIKKDKFNIIKEKQRKRLWWWWCPSRIFPLYCNPQVGNLILKCHICFIIIIIVVALFENKNY